MTINRKTFNLMKNVLVSSYIKILLENNKEKISDVGVFYDTYLHRSGKVGFYSFAIIDKEKYFSSIDTDLSKFQNSISYLPSIEETEKLCFEIVNSIYDSWNLFKEAKELKYMLYNLDTNILEPAFKSHEKPSRIPEREILFDKQENNSDL